jgi:hypothetical protein
MERMKNSQNIAPKGDLSGQGWDGNVAQVKSAHREREKDKGKRTKERDKKGDL